MPVRLNRFFNDPQLGAAAENLASLFAPPSGADAAGYAAAAAKKEEAGRLAELFAYPKNKAFDQTVFDRMGQAAGQWTPANGYYGVDVGAETARRGQDIDAATSLTNNQADNQQRFLSGLYQPLNQGQVRPAVPDSVASLFGVSDIGPDAGLAPALSKTEWDAQQAERLRTSGQLSDADILSTITGDIPVEQVVGSDGEPRFARRPDAVGQQAYVNRGAEAKPTNGMAILRGNRVAVIQGPDGQWREAQTGNPIPPDVEVFELSKQEGAPGEFDATTANITEGNRLSASLDAAEESIARYEALLRNNPGVAGVPGSMMGLAQDAVQSLREISQTFGDKAPEAAVTLDEIRDGLEQFAPNYNPAIQRARTNAAELAYTWAQIQNPSGEVSRQAYERALDALTGGVLRNNASALAGLQGFRDAIASARVKVDRLRNPRATSPVAPAAEEVWQRGPDGRLQRVR